MRAIYLSNLLFIFVTFCPDITLGNDPLVCSYKHTHYSWTTITQLTDEGVKEYHHWDYVDFLFKLYCLNEIAIVSYDKHVLDKFQVKSCNFDDFEAAILVPKRPNKKASKDERNLPTSVNLYYIKNGRQCYKKQYIIKNWENNVRDNGMIQRSGPTEVICSKETGTFGHLNPFGHGQSERYKLDVFGSCKAGSFVYGNVFGVRWDTDKFFPESLSLDPPGIKTDSGTPYDKLLYCTYKTGAYVFKLLCIKFPGVRYYSAYVGEDTKPVSLDSFEVTSCQEDHIVKSIFPPNYSTKNPETGPIHIIKYAFYTDNKCYQRSYNCPRTGNVLGAMPELTTCPSLADVAPAVGSVGLWENCEGPQRSPPIIDLTKD